VPGIVLGHGESLAGVSVSHQPARDHVVVDRTGPIEAFDPL
jgi:hypothetical protein